MRSMDSAQKRKSRCDDENVWVVEEDYLEDFDPCNSI